MFNYKNIQHKVMTVQGHALFTLFTRVLTVIYLTTYLLGAYTQISLKRPYGIG